MDNRLRSGLKAVRNRLGLKQQELATKVGVSRQTLSAIEAGTTVPSTAIALGLARVLQCRVEDLFALAGDASELEALLVTEGTGPGAPAAAAAEASKLRVALAQVGKQWIARSLDGDPALLLGTPADGLATMPRRRPATGLLRVRLLRDLDALARNLFVAGCDPALGLLGRHLEERLHGPRLHWIDLASHAALEELATQRVHVAGLHLDDLDAGNLNAATVRKRLGDAPVVLVTLAAWELGMVFRPQAGRAPRTVADLARKGTRFIGREPGAGARQLLESALRKAKLAWRDLDVVAIARGHRSVAQLVASGAGDVGIATRAAAAPLGLSFVPLAESRFDLAFAAEFAADTRMQVLLECLSSARFRKDLGALTGYRTAKTGSPVPTAPT
jgi:molybdate-binding protein/DNA-binding XRE family transcriptional regulator